MNDNYIIQHPYIFPVSYICTYNNVKNIKMVERYFPEQEKEEDV